jgi:hypothetical protein
MGCEQMGPPVHAEPFELELGTHEPAGCVVHVGSKFRCIQLALSATQGAQPVLDLLTVVQGLPGVLGGGGAAIGGGAGIGSSSSSGCGGFPFPPAIGSPSCFLMGLPCEASEAYPIWLSISRVPPCSLRSKGGSSPCSV